ncbi:hypothetical protein ACYX78_08665 [Advenella incenata]
MNEGKIFQSIKDGVAHINNGFFYVARQGVLFPIWVCIQNPSNSSLTTFFPGSTRRDKPLPIFQRNTYSSSLECDVICTADPTLNFSSDITMAWFAGDRSMHYADLIGQILNEYISSKQYKTVLFYGTSAGGIPVLHAANRITHENVVACIGNAQLNIFNYYPNHFKKLRDVAFVKMDPKLFQEKYPQRINVVGMSFSFSLVCLQNTVDIHHYDNHFQPFKKEYSSNNANSLFIEYEHQQSGHQPLPRENEIAIIQALCSGREVDLAGIPNGRLSDNSTNASDLRHVATE